MKISQLPKAAAAEQLVTAWLIAMKICGDPDLNKIRTPHDKAFYGDAVKGLIVRYGEYDPDDLAEAIKKGATAHSIKIAESQDSEKPIFPSIQIGHISKWIQEHAKRPEVPALPSHEDAERQEWERKYAPEKIDEWAPEKIAQAKAALEALGHSGLIGFHQYYMPVIRWMEKHRADDLAAVRSDSRRAWLIELCKLAHLNPREISDLTSEQAHTATVNNWKYWAGSIYEAQHQCPNLWHFYIEELLKLF